MSGFGSSTVIAPNNNDPAGTVAPVGLYGPRGGNTYFAVLDKAGAEFLIGRLQEQLGEPVEDGRMLDAIACAVGDNFPTSKQHVRTGVARSALARYHRDDGQTSSDAVAEHHGVKVTITRSSATDAAPVVFVDTDESLEGPSGPKIRVSVNDGEVFAGIERGDDVTCDECGAVFEDGNDEPSDRHEPTS